VFDNESPFVIETQNLTVAYKVGRQKIVALNSLNLTVRQGEIFGFLGPNGAGKTTTIKALLGFVPITSGSAKVLGLPAGSTDAKRKIGYLPEVALYYDYLKPREILKLYGRLMGIEITELDDRITALLKQVGLENKENCPLSKFSKGMLQRIGLAQALLGEPELFIFDEPASGLDPIGRKDLRDVMLSLNEKGKTIFFSSHELAEVERICNRISIIRQGTLLETKILDDTITKIGLEDFYVSVVGKDASA